MRSRFLHSAMLVLVCAVLACDGDDDLGPGELSRAEAVARDQAAAAGFTGTLTTNANVSVSRDGQTWYDLGSPNGITIQLQSSTPGTTVHGEVDIPAARYSQVRLTLRNAQATIRAGSTVSGATLTSDVILSVGGSDREVVIQKQVSASTTSGRATFVFDLNTAGWVNTQNLQDRVVEDVEVQQASAVTTR